MSDNRMREPTEAEKADLLDKLGYMKGRDDAVEFKKPAGPGCGKSEAPRPKEKPDNRVTRETYKAVKAMNRDQLSAYILTIYRKAYATGYTAGKNIAAATAAAKAAKAENAEEAAHE